MVRLIELSVAMPVYNCAAFVEQAVRSVLAQADVNFELIVLDDASTDGSFDVVSAIQDPRLRLLKHERNQGIGDCHNRLISESSAPFIAHVDADDFLLPGALRAMVDALVANPKAGQAHCWYLKVDVRGRITRNAYGQRLQSMRSKRQPGLDYRRELMQRGMVANHLRTYRREIFEVIGGFERSLRCFDDYEMSLRIIDKYDIVVVPHFLYCWREYAASTTGALRHQAWNYAWRRWQVLRKHHRRPEAAWMDTTGVPLHQPWRVLWQSQFVRPARHAMRQWSRTLGRIARGVALRAKNAGRYLYATLTPLLAAWPLPGSPAGKAPAARQELHTLYTLERFPVLSQTFIQREVEALRRSGLEVNVCAHSHSSAAELDPRAAELITTTHRLPAWGHAGPGIWWSWMRRRPLRLLGLCCWVLGRPLRPQRSFGHDRRLLSTALAVAEHGRRLETKHVHSPWAARSALVGLIAARLLDARFTVQGRAYDLHRRPHNFGLGERVRHADLVITNTAYNAAHLSTWVAPDRLRVIHNGLDLSRFDALAAEHATADTAAPSAADNTGATSERPLRLLCVARITEQKGLPDLLNACAELRRRGVPVTCEIIGSAQHPVDTNDEIELKLMRRRLDLGEVVRLRGGQPFDSVLEAYRRSDVVVLPAVIAADGGRDIIPNTLLEGLAAGLPVVATAITGIPEIVKHGETGLLVPPHDVPALVAALERLAADPGLRTRLGAAGRADVEARFDIDDNVRAFVEAFTTA